MKLREIYRYELAHRLRSPSTWMYAGFLLLLSGWIFAATAEDPGIINAPERTALASALASTMGVLVVAALFGDAAVRDYHSGMDPLLFTSPIRKIDYLGGRFLAALSVNALILMAVPVGIALCTLVIRQFDATAIGPFRLLAYVQPFVLLVLPNLIVAGTALFAIGVFARHVVPVYLGAIGLLICAVVAMNALELTQNQFVLLVSDPIGLSTFRSLIKYWTEAERSTRLVGFPKELLFNRLLWLSVAGVVFALLHRTFKLEHVGVRSSKRDRRSEARRASMSARIMTAGSADAVDVPRVTGVFGSGTTFRQTMAVARNSLDEITGTRWFKVVIAACTGFTLLWGWNVGSSVFDTSTWPVTFLITETVLSERVNPLVYALIALFAAELVWKDRNSKVDEIADAAPISEGALMMGRFLALTAMIWMFAAALMIGGLLIQLLQGYYHIELDLYVKTLFGINMVKYLIFAALAMTVQVLVKHKYVGHLVLLLLFVAQLSLQMLGYVQHHLLLYNTDPGWTYSDMNRFGPFMTAVLWFKAYWAAWALLLGVVATLFWVRGREQGLRNRLRLARQRLIGPVVRATAVAVVLIGSLGGFVFYNTNVLNEYRSRDEAGLEKAQYEKNYRRYVDAAQPVITNADLRIEIYPEQRAAEIGGSYRLLNKTALPIDSIHVMLADRNVNARSISFDRPAKAVLTDDAAQYRIFKLDRALLPGDSVQLKFDLEYRQRGFTNSQAPTLIAANGSKFNRLLAPFVGYQPFFELNDDEARKRFGLNARAATPSAMTADRLQYRETIRDADEVQVHAIIGTAANQTAITPGVLKKSWTEKGRRYFEYATLAPTSYGMLVVSGNYEVTTDKWRDIPLQVFHHPEHRENLDRTIKSMKASLDYFTSQFGPYPDNQVRLVEVPRYGGFGAAHPNVITFTEDYFLSRVNDGEVDQPFYGTAHELAHTWWGGLKGAAVRGSGFLTESGANYSAMMVTEKTYGPEVAQRVYDFQMERYLVGRASQSNEVPVLEVEDQPYIAYRKGALALYTLREHIGEAAVNGAMHKFQDKYRNSGPPYATSYDLYAELKAVTPDSLQTLLVDWFETVTLWELDLQKATVAKLASGETEVTLEVLAKKLRADSVGNLTDTPMDDNVEIGVFAEGETTSALAPMYRRMHRIKSGRQTLRIRVPREPKNAGIDPRRKLIDRNRDDNVRSVEPKIVRDPAKP